MSHIIFVWLLEFWMFGVDQLCAQPGHSSGFLCSPVLWYFVLSFFAFLFIFWSCEKLLADQEPWFSWTWKTNGLCEPFCYAVNKIHRGPVPPREDFTFPGCRVLSLRECLLWGASHSCMCEPTFTNLYWACAVVGYPILGGFRFLNSNSFTPWSQGLLLRDLYCLYCHSIWAFSAGILYVCTCKCNTHIHTSKLYIL